MKLKKILAATLTTSMLFSGIAFTGVGVTEVQAVNGESQTARIAGTNIAHNAGIVAYSGNADNSHTARHLMDNYGNNNNNDDARWLSGVALKKGTTPTGKTSYIVYDLGVNGPRSYEGIKLKFHNKAYATKYKIYTSDSNSYDNEKDQINPEEEGWDLVQEFTRQGHNQSTTYPLDELGKQTGLKRHILFCFTEMNMQDANVTNQISIREIEIYHQAITSITLPESKDMLVGDDTTLEVAIAPENATYKDVVWSVENISEGTGETVVEDVVTVDAEGRVIANRSGRACVTVTAKDDATKTASCIVTVQERKGDLNQAIAEASKLQQEDYTANSWGVFAEALKGAKEVSGNIYATKFEIREAFEALMEAQEALKRVYKVTVTNNGDPEIRNCEVGEQVTVVAEQAPEGYKFSHWAVDGKAICYKESYTFTVYKDTEVKSVYIPVSETVKKEVSVLCNVSYENGKVKFVSKHSVPADAGYTVLRTGVVATDTKGYDAIRDASQDLTLETTATTRLKKYGADTNYYLANFTQYLKTSRATTWYARGYVTYRDSEGTHTVYSDMAEYTIQ